MREIPTFDPRRAGADPALTLAVGSFDHMVDADTETAPASTLMELAPGGRVRVSRWV